MTTCDCENGHHHEGKKLDEVTFIAFAHVVCKGCGYGMRADVIEHDNKLTLGVPTKCVHCHKWRGIIKPGKV